MKVASYMRKLGLEQGDFVGVIVRLTTHLTALAYACFFNGTPYHALHTEYEHSAIERLFGITKPRLIFCDGDEFEKVQVLNYTLTELNSTGCLNFNFDEKPNSVGRPVIGIQIKIVNELGEAQGPNVVGEICFNNGQKWSGYYKNAEETKKMQDSENWFHTGDLGYMDEDGYLFIIDRLNDMLKYQTIMYYPSEIESVIAEMPNVVEACVFGIWDPVNGDKAAASVVQKPGTQLEAQDVVEYVSKRIPAKFKQLNGGALIVDHIIQSGNRKPNRAATKAEFLRIMDKN
ncbi:GM14724 [Drosophila sechellia]|uniref:GM14724 n=1 Tax=Drosophila sechellia TaxID=7238 RepID=B4HUJ8_DROSE|nr:GM14724 [Drosophila sechellia]